MGFCRMTTAHRATYTSAKGGASRGENDLGKLSKQYSSRDLPSHTKLKHRQIGRNSQDEVNRRDLRRELEDRERSSRSDKRSDARSRDSKRPRLEDMLPFTTETLDSESYIYGSDDDDDDDDTEALVAELKKIKNERAEERAKAEIEKKEDERIRTENILSGNPLLNNARPNGDFAVKRRWDDDVVFKNCARGLSDKPKQSFINDTLRSEFHKKFMDKYVK